MKKSYVCHILASAAGVLLAALPLGHGGELSVRDDVSKEIAAPAEQPMVIDTVTLPVKLEKATFLGIAPKPVPAAEAAQLKLPSHVGLIVESIVPDSPAAKAGLQQWDVIDKLDDQILINPGQLIVLVRMHKPGDEIKLSVTRKGEHQDVTVKLGEKELPPVESELEENGGVEHMLMHMLPGGNAAFGEAPATPEAWKNWLMQMQGSSIWTDGKNTMTLTTKNGKPLRLNIKDKEKTIFDGSVETEVQQKLIPDEFKERFEKMTRELQNHGSMKAMPVPGPVFPPPPPERDAD